jgi:hypothetical protein
MKFRRRMTKPTGRQKLHSDDLVPLSAAFTYRGRRRLEENRAGSRQAKRDTPGAPRHGLAHFWLQRFGLIILLLAITVSLVNILSLSDAAKVVLLSDDMNRAFLQPLTIYQQAADKQLAGSVWNRNKITLDTNALSQHLLRQFPELSSVSVTVPLLAHRPLVYVEPAQPALILIGSNGGFVIDDTGKALLAATDPAVLGQTNKLPVVDDQNGLKVERNHQVLSVDNINFIKTITGQLAAKQFAVAGMTLPAGTNELDVHLNGQPYFIKFNLESTNPRGEAGTFLAVISQLQRQNITPSQYIDTRVDGRAYYR